MNPNVTIDGMHGRIGENGMVDFRADDRVNVNFYKKSVLDPVKSQQAGRPVHVSMDYVRIQQPGEKDFADRPVADDPSVTLRWPNHWARFQQNQQQTPVGTPIDMLFPTRPEIPANLKQLGVFTIEQLANLTAEGITQIGMGAAQWHSQAKEYLATAQRGVGHHELQKQLAERDNTIEVQGNQIAMLKRQVETLMAKVGGVPDTMIPTERPQYMQSAPLPPSTFQPVTAADPAYLVSQSPETAEIVSQLQDAPSEATVATPDAINAMNRNELFAYLGERGIPCGVPIKNEQLRQLALESLQPAAA